MTIQPMTLQDPWIETARTQRRRLVVLQNGKAYDPRIANVPMLGESLILELDQALIDDIERTAGHTVGERAPAP